MINALHNPTGIQCCCKNIETGDFVTHRISALQPLLNSWFKEQNTLLRALWDCTTVLLLLLKYFECKPRSQDSVCMKSSFLRPTIHCQKIILMNH